VLEIDAVVSLNKDPHAIVFMHLGVCCRKDAEPDQAPATAHDPITIRFARHLSPSKSGFISFASPSKRESQSGNGTALIAFLTYALRLPHQTDSRVYRQASYHSAAFAMTQLTIHIVIGPALEEIFWRGYIQNTLTKVFGSWVGILGQAILFALVHLRNVLGALDVLLIGLLFGVWRHRRRTLIPIILVHVANNTLYQVVRSQSHETNAAQTGASCLVRPIEVSASTGLHAWSNISSDPEQRESATAHKIFSRLVVDRCVQLPAGAHSKSELVGP
jgi:membrane protease YdiL (CAAX protease family)